MWCQGVQIDQPAVPYLAFERDRFTIREGEQTLQGRFTVETATTPAQIVLVRAADGKEIRRIELAPAILNPGKHGPNEVPGEVRSLALTPDGKQILVGGAGGFVQLWNIASGELVRRFEGCGDTVSAGGGRAEGGKMLAGEDFTIRLWDLTLVTRGKKVAAESPSAEGRSPTPD